MRAGIGLLQGPGLLGIGEIAVGLGDHGPDGFERAMDGLPVHGLPRGFDGTRRQGGQDRLVISLR